MEEKENTVSGSPGNSMSDSPPPVMSNLVVPSPLVNMDINMSMSMGMGIERSLGGGAAATTEGAATTMTMTTTTAITPGSGGLGSSSGGDLFGKKKRGRPRKYDADGNLRVPYPVGVSSPPGFSLSPSPEFSSKRGRGRPPGSGNWQLLASLGELFANTAGGDFTPHVVTVNTGEDVAGKILSFSQKGPRGICVLSANGAVSNVTIRQPGSSGGILTYEGRFEILSLSGSFTLSDTGGVRSRTGGLSVSLAGPDGRVIGGAVAGLLTAASPIQIVIGSFMPNGYKAHKRKHYREHTAPSGIPATPDTVTAARPISQAKPDGETCLTPISPVYEQKHGETDNRPNDMQLNATSSNSAGWNVSEPTSIHRPSPDINISVPSE